MDWFKIIWAIKKMSAKYIAAVDEAEGYADDAKDSAEEAAQSAEQAANFVGAPLTAPTAADMTDTTKIYVYTGTETGYVNGDWYYYNGSAWTDGGTYNSAGVEFHDRDNNAYYLMELGCENGYPIIKLTEKGN